MKFVNSSFEIIPQEIGLDGLYKHVEKVARVSYKSEDKITDGSAKKMIDLLIENKHLSCLEHGTIYLKFPMRLSSLCTKYLDNPYSKVSKKANTFIYVTTNWRVIVENQWEEDLQYMCEPTEFHEKRYTVKFILSAGIGREFTRHRKFSFLQESSRFCNYSRGKFNGELTFIIPEWIYDVQAEKASYRDPLTGEKMNWLMDLTGEDLVNQLTCEDRVVAAYVNNLEHCERDYMYLVSATDGYRLKAQEARGILPLDIKSELIMTGFTEDWIHFFNLRSYIAMTGKPHPDAMYLANNLLDEFLERNYIKYDQLYNKDKMVVTRSEETS